MATITVLPDLASLPSPQDMNALTKNDRKWLSDEIAAGIAAGIESLRPHGWRRFTHLLREWSLVSTAIMLPVALLSVAVGAIYVAVAKVEERAKFEANTTNSLSEISDHLKHLDQAVSTLQIDGAAENPSDKNAAINAKRAIDSARKNSVQLAPSLIERAGQKFVDASKQHSSAWDAALAFLDYRTLLNGAPPPSLSKPVVLTPKTKIGEYIPGFFSRRKSGIEGEQSRFMGTYWHGDELASAEESARMESLSNPQPQGSGYKELFIKFGGADEFVLDGEFLKNVTIIDADVDYDGGPVKLENVVFINCRFHFQNVNPSRDLGSTILRASNVTFTQTVG